MFDRPQHDHADLGLNPEADHTEDMRPVKGNAPGRCANTAEGLQNHPITNRKEVQP